MIEEIVMRNKSLPLWQADEAILADNLNLRGRRYGGFYIEDFWTAFQNDPSFYEDDGGIVYADGTYGFATYGGGDNAELDSIALDADTLSFSSAEDVSVYGTTVQYGFAGYSGSYIEDTLVSSEPTIDMNDSASTAKYNEGGVRALMQYQTADPYESEISLEDDAPTFTTNIINSNTYGTSRKRGFCVYQP